MPEPSPVVIPDEAVERAASLIFDSWDMGPGTREAAIRDTRRGLEAVGPAIVAANPPKPADDLVLVMARAFWEHVEAGFPPQYRETWDGTWRKAAELGADIPASCQRAFDVASALAPAVQAFLGTQVAAARAEGAEQAFREAAALVRELEGEYTDRLGSRTLAGRADALRPSALGTQRPTEGGEQHG